VKLREKRDQTFSHRMLTKKVSDKGLNKTEGHLGYVLQTKEKGGYILKANRERI